MATTAWNVFLFFFFWHFRKENWPQNRLVSPFMEILDPSLLKTGTNFFLIQHFQDNGGGEASVARKTGNFEVAGKKNKTQ